MYADEGEQVTVACAGDATITRRISNLIDTDEDNVVSAIREADVGVINLEVPLHDYEGYPSAQSGGTYMCAPPAVADELTWAGFDMFAAASNHSGDYSVSGMEATMRELEDRDIPYAGLGRDLAGAREPAYLDTSAGRVGMVAACSTVTPGTEAGPQGTYMQGRPGISYLRLDCKYGVPPEAFENIREISEELGLEEIKSRLQTLGHPSATADESGEHTFLNAVEGDDITFERTDEYGVTVTPNSEDVEDIVRRVESARRQADWVVASLHAHEGAAGRRNDQSVPDFLEDVARQCVEAGADVVFGHGPHRIRGIEVYEGAPIFYSLGNFVMQIESITHLPPEMYDANGLPLDSTPGELFDQRVFDDGERFGILDDRSFWDGIVPVCAFEGGEFSHATLYPIELGYDESRGRRGVPQLASGTDADRIIESAKSVSAEYGTAIERTDDGAVVKAD